MPLRLYLAVAFGFSWVLGLVVFLLGPSTPVAVRTALLAVYMFGPALGALVAQRAAKEPVLAPLGVRFSLNRWWLVAWLLPFALQPLVIAIALAMPGVEWSPDMSGFLERLAQTMPPEQLEAGKQQLEAMPRALYWVFLFVQPLIAGVTVNALAAFGEELGWRGFLFRHFEGLGFWRRAALVGAVWGLWHAPIILQGHNYPQHPVAGVAGMTVFCMLLAPLADLVRLRGGSVWAAAVLHGTINATAGLGVFFLRGGSDLTIGLTGLAGLLSLLVADVALWLVDRNRGGALTART